MQSLNILVILSSLLVFVSARLSLEDVKERRLFDEELYESVIDNEECEKQVRFMMGEDETSLLGRFLDAGIRLPRGFYTLAFTDLGNYYQCLAIDEEMEDMKFEGKYCMITVPFEQNFQLPFYDDFNISDYRNRKFVHFGDPISEVQTFALPIDLDAESLNPGNPLLFGEFRLAVCIPKPCTTQEFMRNVLFNLTAIGFEYEDQYCRLPNDKPWAPVDYVAISIFSLLGFVTLISTLYDITHTLIQKRDPKKANLYLRTFSVYTNTKRLLTFAPSADALECLDGIRSISMMWVLLGHTFSMATFHANLSEALQWLTSGHAVIISTGLFTVDTFFLISGLLLVYTSVGRMTGAQLLKRLHAFYINRILRMMPLLVGVILLDASIYHHIADGPYWNNIARNAQRCRSFWWTTLLHVQNYVNPGDMCIQHSWYIAIDIQLHLVSPIVLYWVLSKNRSSAWTAMITSTLVVIVSSTIWNFIMELPSTNMTLQRLEEQDYYMNNYYVLAWTRAAPFFIGMILGYILYIYKGKEIKLNKGFVVVCWGAALGMIALAFYTSYAIMQFDWDNQVGDSLFNSFMRCVWSFGVGWIIFACVKGYGGPINWLLSLSLWRVPARISFAMYLYHYSINFIVAGMQITPMYFSAGARMYDFLAILFLCYLLSFLVTVVIDAPFSILIKKLMGGGPKKPRKPAANGANSSKSGKLSDKNVKDLERTIITTLTKDPSLEKTPLHLEANGTIVINDKNGTLEPIEEGGEPLANNKEMSKF